MNVPTSLQGKDINGYTDAAHARKERFHKDGKKFMKELAAALGITDACDIRSNKAGPAVSGEVSLHGDHIYVQLSGSYHEGPQLLYRSCKNRKDYTGGTNNFISMEKLASSLQARDNFVKHCKSLMAAAQEVAGAAVSA